MVQFKSTGERQRCRIVIEEQMGRHAKSVVGPRRHRHERLHVIVIQAVFVDINKRSRSTDSARRDVTGRRLSLYVIGDSVVVAVQVKLVCDSIGITVRQRADLQIHNPNSSVVRIGGARNRGQRLEDDREIVSVANECHLTA